MLNSGVNTGVVTAGNAAVTLIATGGQLFNRVVVVNTATGAGFVSIDGGVTWAYLPAATTSAAGYLELWQTGTGDIQVKRMPGGADITCFGFANLVQGT